MMAVTLAYTLRTGQRGTLHCLASSTADALLLAMDTWGLALRTCSARRAGPGATGGLA